MGYIPTVNKSKCVGCKECVNVCPCGIFKIRDGKSVPVDSEDCLGCESCVEVCESDAITIVDKDDTYSDDTTHTLSASERYGYQTRIWC